MSETVQILGLRELREALMRKIPAEFHKGVLQKALVAGARPIVAEAKALAPSDTGILRASIHSERRRSESSFGHETRVIKVRSKRGGKLIRARERARGKPYKQRNRGSGAPYWWHVEFGTRFMSAQAFLRPAFEMKKFESLLEIKRGLSVALVEAIRKARWRTPRV